MKPPRPSLQYLIAVVAVLFLMSIVLATEGHCESVDSDGPSWLEGQPVAVAMQRLGSEAPPKTTYRPLGSRAAAGIKPGLGPSEFTGVKRNRWNWKGAALTYGSGIAFDRLTTELALSRGALETNHWRQSQAGHWRTDALVFAGAMLADRLLFSVDPRAPKFLRGAAVGIYATRGGLNLKVVW